MLLAHGLRGINNVLSSEEIKKRSLAEWAKINLFEFTISLPNVLLCEMIKDPRFSIFAPYVPLSTKYAKPCHNHFSSCIDSPGDLNIQGVLNAEQDSLLNTTLFILSDQEKNVDAFIKQVTSTTVMGSEPSVSSKLAQYFAELSYYFPISKRHHLLDLRCTLAIYQK